MDLELHELRRAATENGEGFTKVMWDAYRAHNNPTIYPQPPPDEDQPPPTAFLGFIQESKYTARKPDAGDAVDTRKVGVAGRRSPPIPSNKQRRELEEATQASAQVRKQGQFPIGGLLNPHM